MNVLSNKTTHTQFLVGKLSLPDVLCNLVKDYLFIDQICSYYRHYMKKNVLTLIKSATCSEFENPESHLTAGIISYRFNKKYRSGKQSSIMEMESTICVSCGNYRVYNGCLNSMCTCTETYDEWSEYDDEIEYDDHPHFMMDEEWVQERTKEELIKNYGESDFYIYSRFILHKPYEAL
jgi:hypothetical protein